MARCVNVRERRRAHEPNGSQGARPAGARPGSRRWRRAALPALALSGLALGLLAGCSPAAPQEAGPGLTVQSEGMAAAAGTWTWKDYLGNEGSQGTALLAGFRFVAASPWQVATDFAGPAGWNGDVPLELALGYTGTVYPHDQWQYALLTDAPPSEPLDVTTDAVDTVYHATVVPGVGARLDPPVVEPPSIQGQQVTVRWQPVSGAAAYHVVLSSKRTMSAGDRLAEVFGTATEVTLVSAEPLKTPWLYVVAFSSDLVLGATSNDAVDPAPDSFSVASTEVRLQP